MVSSQSQSSKDIPVAFQPPEIIPDSQPQPSKCEKKLEENKEDKKAADEVEYEDGPPEFVDSEDESDDDEEEEHETEQYLLRFPVVKGKEGKKEGVASSTKTTRRRVIPRRPSKFSFEIFIKPLN